MNIYRVSLRGARSESNRGEHLGYEYFANLRDAKRLQRAQNKGSEHDDTIDIIEVKMPITKAELLRVLYEWGAHPDNG
jgi:hypothetical protein